MTTLDYQTRAARHNKRTAKRFPLFAAGGVLHEVVEPWTSDSVREMEDVYQERTTACRRQQYADGARMRNDVLAGIGPVATRSLDRFFARTYPHKGEYFCDFWRKQLARLREAERERETVRALRLVERGASQDGHRHREPMGTMQSPVT